MLYLDTSALLRLYTAEPDHEQVRQVVVKSAGVVCHQITYVEALAALTGRRRRNLLRDREYRAAQQAFETDWPTFRHVGIDDTLLQDAARLAQEYGLRAYDSVHLAAAKAVLPLGVTFVTFDLKLREVATVVLPQVWTPVTRE